MRTGKILARVARQWRMRRKSGQACALLIALSLGTAGCTGPAWRGDIRPQWRESVENGAQFRHRVWFKPGRGDRLHIYLEGDGRIWRTPQQLYADPTPQRALTLQLMRQDPAPALFIGRPCYFDVEDTQCQPRWWTAARYSQPVVDSLVAVAARWSQPYAGTVLIGHSGGGALAVLMAPQLPSTQAVITIAGNLDIEQWVRRHDYAAQVVDASLNPIAQPPLPAHIAQWHYAGSADDNVLWPWIEAYSARQSGAHFIRKEHGHHCCWAAQWPAMLLETQNSIR